MIWKNDSISAIFYCRYTTDQHSAKQEKAISRTGGKSYCRRENFPGISIYDERRSDENLAGVFVDSFDTVSNDNPLPTGRDDVL